jgi:hypothetical protein
MAKALKSRPRRKAARGSPAAKRAKRRASPQRRKVAKTPAPQPLDDLIDAAASLLALSIKPSWRPAIKANLDVTLRFAALVAELPLPDEAEPAPIFTA